MTMEAYIDERAIAELAGLLARLYLTVAIMAVGFATMSAGGRGASSVARMFFARPLQVLAGGVTRVLARVLGVVWQAITAVARTFARAMRRELKELAADAHWLATRGRGWLGR
jgi:hypothetical protein